MKKNFEAPIIRTIRFETSESLTSDAEASLSNNLGWEDGLEPW